MSYHKWEINLDKVNEYSETLKKDMISRYCLLLPILTENEFSKVSDPPHFTMIDSDWNVINKENKFEPCKVEGATYAY